MSNQHFGKIQSTLLVAVVYWRRKPEAGTDEPEDGVVDHFYYDFVSKYLGHNGMFFGKCLDRLMKYLIDEREMNIEVMYSVTDGATHFVSRFCFWTYNTVAIKFGQYPSFFFPGTQKIIFFF